MYLVHTTGVTMRVNKTVSDMHARCDAENKHGWVLQEALSKEQKDAGQRFVKDGGKGTDSNPIDGRDSMREFCKAMNLKSPYYGPDPSKDGKGAKSKDKASEKQKTADAKKVVKKDAASAAKSSKGSKKETNTEKKSKDVDSNDSNKKARTAIGGAATCSITVTGATGTTVCSIIAPSYVLGTDIHTVEENEENAYPGFGRGYIVPSFAAIELNKLVGIDPLVKQVDIVVTSVLESLAGILVHVIDPAGKDDVRIFEDFTVCTNSIDSIQQMSCNDDALRTTIKLVKRFGEMALKIQEGYETAIAKKVSLQSAPKEMPKKTMFTKWADIVDEDERKAGAGDISVTDAILAHSSSDVRLTITTVLDEFESIGGLKQIVDHAVDLVIEKPAPGKTESPCICRNVRNVDLNALNIEVSPMKRASVLHFALAKWAEHDEKCKATAEEKKKEITLFPSYLKAFHTQKPTVANAATLSPWLFNEELKIKINLVLEVQGRYQTPIHKILIEGAKPLIRECLFNRLTTRRILVPAPTDIQHVFEEPVEYFKFLDNIDPKRIAVPRNVVKDAPKGEISNNKPLSMAVAEYFANAKQEEEQKPDDTWPDEGEGDPGSEEDEESHSDDDAVSHSSHDTGASGVTDVSTPAGTLKSKSRSSSKNKEKRGKQM